MKTITLAIGDRILRVAFDSAPASAYLQGAYRRLIVPNSVAPHHRAVIAVADIPARIWFDDEAIDMPPEHCADGFLGVFYGMRSILQRTFAANTTFTAWYAAGISINGTGIALSAPSGVGKTTLALELLRRGHGFFGDEFILVRKSDRHIVPFPRGLMVREPTVRIFERELQLAAACAHSIQTTYQRRPAFHDVDPCDAVGRNVIADPAPLRVGILLERGHVTQLHPLSSSVFGMSVAPRVCDARGATRLWDFLETLSGIRCFRLLLGTPQSGADAVMEAVRAL